MVLDIFALLVMLLLAAVTIALVVFLGTLPGKWAREVHHPQAEAINIGLDRPVNRRHRLGSRPGVVEIQNR